jgi:Putative transposase
MDKRSETLSHENRGQILLGIDPENRTRCSSPRIVAFGAGIRRLANCQTDREAEAESVTWPGQVYAKKPFGGPKAVLAYLSRYTHRVAISNRRLVYQKSVGRWDVNRGRASTLPGSRAIYLC